MTNGTNSPKLPQKSKIRHLSSYDYMEFQLIYKIQFYRSIRLLDEQDILRKIILPLGHATKLIQNR